MKLSVILLTVLTTGCSALPRSLPPEQFRAEFRRGDFASQERRTTVSREYRYGIPTGRTYETR